MSDEPGLEESTVSARSLREYWPWMVASFVAVAGCVALVILLLSSGGTSNVAQRLPSLPTPGDSATTLRGDVRQVSGSTVTVGAGADLRQLTVGADTRVEALNPAPPSSIAVGDYVSIGGAPNLVNSIAVKLVIVIPAGEAGEPVAGVPRSKAGFTGWEAYLDGAAPKLYGRVDNTDAGGIHLSGVLGAFTLTLDPATSVRRLSPGGVELIHGGDHVAYSAGSGANPRAFLVLPP